MFHNADGFDSLKGAENLTGVKTIWATEIRSVHGELKARSKNENLVCFNIIAIIIQTTADCGG
jgi:hypothetical protein